MFKRGKFRGGLLPDLTEDGEDDEMMGPVWPPRVQNRSQRKRQIDVLDNENSELIDIGDHQHSNSMESKSEQLIISDKTSIDTIDDENMNSNNRSRITRGNQQQNSMPIENRSRRYCDGNTTANSSNNRRLNDRDRLSWQDRSGNNNSGTNTSANNQRFRSDTGSSTNHGPPICRFFIENRCMKVSFILTEKI